MCIITTPPAIPPTYKGIGNFKDISFSNNQVQLNNGKKAKVVLSYKDDDPPYDIVDGTDISVYDLQICNKHDDVWTCLNSTVDPVNKKVKANSDKFSPYGLLVPPKLSGNGLTMVAVPLNATPNDTASVLGYVNQYGTYAPTWSPLTNSWIERPSIVEPGKGYFIWANGNDLDVSGDDVEQIPFTIDLSPGWNMIGNPFQRQGDDVCTGMTAYHGIPLGIPIQNYRA